MTEEKLSLNYTVHSSAILRCTISSNLSYGKKLCLLTFIPERSFPTFSRSTGFLFHSFIKV